jgi:hypothetical protein
MLSKSDGDPLDVWRENEKKKIKKDKKYLQHMVFPRRPRP